MDKLLDIAPCGVVLFDDGGRILEANATLTAWLGYEETGLNGKNIHSILSLASRVFYSTHFFPLIKLHHRADEIFLTLVSNENKAIPVLSNALRRVTSTGVENIVVFMPVAERKKFEEELIAARRAAEKALAESTELQRLNEMLKTHSLALERQNQKILSINEDLVQFNKIISHDLQEPIRKIRLFTDMMLDSRDLPLSGRDRMAIEKIEKSAKRLNELTSDLQQYIKVDDESHCELIDLNDCIFTAAARVKQFRNFHDFEISVGTLPAIGGYPGQLQLLFYHVIDNAIKFRNLHRRLEIRVDHMILEENLYRSMPDRYEYVEHLRITISDNGIGIDNLFKDQLFELGKKFHAGQEGIGVGLALMKKIVTNHGGTISVESKPGKGTDVVLLLPLGEVKA